MIHLQSMPEELDVGAGAFACFAAKARLPGTDFVHAFPSSRAASSRARAAAARASSSSLPGTGATAGGRRPRNSLRSRRISAADSAGSKARTEER
jgi:hypothetical protein